MMRFAFIVCSMLVSAVAWAEVPRSPETTPAAAAGRSDAAPAADSEAATPAAPDQQPIGPGPRLILAGSVDFLDADKVGGTGSLDLVVPTLGGRSWIVGFESRKADSLEWWVGRAGLGGTIQGPWYGEAQLQVGPGRLADDGFTYWKTRAGLGRRIGQSAGLDLTHSYLDIHDTQGHLLMLGVWLSALENWMIRVDLSQMVAGDLDTRSVAARTDIDLTRLRVIAGGAYGETRAELVGLARTRPKPIELREIYAGFKVPWRGFEFGLIASQLWAGSSDRTSLLLSIDVPLSPLRGILP